MKLTPKIVAEVDWLPESCAYRLVHEGKDLHDWHHLVCGDRNAVHRRGYSAMDKTHTEEGVVTRTRWTTSSTGSTAPPPETPG